VCLCVCVRVQYAIRHVSSLPNSLIAYCTHTHTHTHRCYCGKLPKQQAGNQICPWGGYSADPPTPPLCVCEMVCVCVCACACVYEFPRTPERISCWEHEAFRPSPDLPD